MKYYKVTGKENLVRDCETNAIINTDRAAYEEYKLEYNKKLSEKKKIESIESDLSSLKSDIEEIKSLLKGLIK